MMNRQNEHSVRYIEHQSFRLWQYLMANKHHLQVTEASLCLWLADPEWQQQPGYFQAAGSNEPVCLLRFELFDEANSVHDRIQRFVVADDAGNTQARLLARIPASVKALPDFSATLVQGHAIIQQPRANLTTLGQALSAETSLH